MCSDSKHSSHSHSALLFHTFPYVFSQANGKTVHQRRQEEAALPGDGHHSGWLRCLLMYCYSPSINSHGIKENDQPLLRSSGFFLIKAWPPQNNQLHLNSHDTFKKIQKEKENITNTNYTFLPDARKAACSSNKYEIQNTISD